MTSGGSRGAITISHCFHFLSRTNWRFVFQNWNRLWWRVSGSGCEVQRGFMLLQPFLSFSLPLFSFLFFFSASVCVCACVGVLFVFWPPHALRRNTRLFYSSVDVCAVLCSAFTAETRAALQNKPPQKPRRRRQGHARSTV